MKPLLAAELLGVDLQGWSKILVVAAALTLALGSLLQARQELREYKDVLEESGWTETAATVVRISVGAAGAPAGIFSGAKKLFAQLQKASEWNRDVAKSDPEKWRRADTALHKALNWGIVLLGSTLAAGAAGLDVIDYF